MQGVVIYKYFSKKYRNKLPELVEICELHMTFEQ